MELKFVLLSKKHTIKNHLSIYKAKQITKKLAHDSHRGLTTTQTQNSNAL